MRSLGYRTSFLYGGYGYFDNMNAYFGENGFDVLDRRSIRSVRFKNIWGVSDEDLFDHSLAYFDRLHAAGGPFFSIIMTTSNQKPFTFRMGLEAQGIPPEGGGRPAGVRYADFALGRFLRDARDHPWFDDTVFVVAADHGARVYGAEQIPLRTYEIPLMIYRRSISPRGGSTRSQHRSTLRRPCSACWDCPTRHPSLARIRSTRPSRAASRSSNTMTLRSTGMAGSSFLGSEIGEHI